MKAKIEEHTLGRLRLVARDFGIPQPHLFTTTGSLTAAIEKRWRAEAEQERLTREDIATVLRDSRHYAVVARAHGIAPETVMALRMRQTA
jgi:hypothetical protein